MPEKLAVTWEQYVRNGAASRELIDHFLTGPGWAAFDPELGYVSQNSLMPWGIDDSRTIETFGPTGARSAFLYADRVPRINTYGDSFTEGNQVSDGETWQEYLAGHLGEPIANYGVGGYGVYQAYRRMVREESTEHGAEYVILYIWGDDPVRSLMRARWLQRYPWFADQSQSRRGTGWGRRGNLQFHGNPWAHIELDLSTGRFTEHASLLTTPESVYSLCDPDWLWEHLGDDLAVQLYAYGAGLTTEFDREKADALAGFLGFDFDGAADPQEQANRLLHVYGQRATNHILDMARAYTVANGKKLLVALNFTARIGAPIRTAPTPIAVSSDGERTDQLIVDHLAGGGFHYFDMNEVHRLEYERMAPMGLSYPDYLDLYRVRGGHYSPRGNHLFAYAIKDSLIALLDPKPLPYREANTAAPIDFEGYLPRFH
jgi:hypothetical protein